MIKVTLNEEQSKQLEQARGQTSSENSEKTLMVMMSSKGDSPVRIARTLERHPHTVRKWLKQYKADGEKGLDRRYSPGRPNKTREQVKTLLMEILDKSPAEVGYQDASWTVALMVHHIKQQTAILVSEDTIERALKEMDYTYKRSAKGVSEKAPGKEEKKEAITRLIAEIMELEKQHDCEIFALDESHFSTEPYLIRGWQKKRWPPEDTNTSQTGKTHTLWVLESPHKKILLEKIETW